MSVSERYPSYRESNKRSEERQGPTLSVCFTEVSVLEVSVKRESTVNLHLSSYSMTQTFEQASASSALNESSAKCLHISLLSSSIFFFKTEEECMYIGK